MFDQEFVIEYAWPWVYDRPDFIECIRTDDASRCYKDRVAQKYALRRSTMGKNVYYHCPSCGAGLLLPQEALKCCDNMKQKGRGRRVT
jgi:hypothetical protein